MTSCPVCNAFETSDATELERHIEACLNESDARLARQLAAEESLAVAAIASSSERRRLLLVSFVRW